jgi:DNA-binding protein H-NS
MPTQGKSILVVGRSTAPWLVPSGSTWHHPPYQRDQRQQDEARTSSQKEQSNFSHYPTQSASTLFEVYTVFAPQITMPKINLSRMTIEALIDLRKQVDETLLERRADIEQQLKRMGAVVGGARIVRGGGGALRGRKVPPKYRGPSGETWAGRGARPVWLVAAIKDGKKIDDFLIDKARRKRRSKR